MKSATAVIGAHYGDEGKGLAVDYFASKAARPLVIRHNSGGQCSHTVVTPSGNRHVFGHIGAGAFTGAPTLLTRYFVSNPLLFHRELPEIGFIRPKVFVESGSYVTTPYDMLLNQIVETSRGSSRHGSCGVGFNETIERSLNSDPLLVGDLSNKDLTLNLLRDIRDSWVPKRLSALGITKVSDYHQGLLDSDVLLDNFYEVCQSFLQDVPIVSDLKLFLDTDWDVIFESGQGLILDEMSSDFPHVTRSRTGLPNISKILSEVNFKGYLDVHYMSRWYVTRHGDGPFPNEDPDFLKKNSHIEETTNVPNPWQGTLRYGNLAPDILAKNTNQDLDAYPGSVNPHIFLTCLDQLIDPVHPTYQRSRDLVASMLTSLDSLGMPVDTVSYGNHRELINSI